MTGPGLPDGAFDNVVVVSTAYHLLLAQLLPGDARFAGRTLLVLTGAREQVAVLHQAMTDGGCAPFDALTFLPRTGKTLRAERQRAGWFAALDAALRPARVVIFNDQTPDLQFLCRRARARGAQTFCGEDGGCAYSQRSWAAPRRRHLARALFFGPWVQNRAAVGDTRAVGAVLAVYPDLVRPELRRKPVLGLATAALPGLEQAPWTGQFLRALGLSPAALVCNAVYAPTYSGAVRDLARLRAVLREHLQDSLRAGHACAVKYHPRERGDYLDAAALGARVLPAALPVELVYQASGAALQTVVGDAGTTLLSARWLAPRARAVSALAYTGIDDPYYAAVLKRLGVVLLA